MADNMEGNIHIKTQAGKYKADWTPLELSYPLISANSPIPIQVGWNGVSNDMNNYVASLEGDVVNVIVDIYMGNLHDDSSAIPNMIHVASISKAKDLPYVESLFSNPNTPWQWFTFDIQPICADLLSYTLCPAGKGTIASPNYGGLNGGKVGNIVSGLTSPIKSSLGAFRWIDFQVTAQVLDANLQLTDWVDTGSGVKLYKKGKSFAIINNVQQWTDAHNCEKYRMDGGHLTERQEKEFFTNCPNFDRTGTHKTEYTKPVKLADDSEFLHFYIDGGLVKANGDKDMRDMGIKITSDDSDVMYLQDFFSNLGVSAITNATDIDFKRYCIQNVSPQTILATDPSFSFGAGSYRAVLVMQRTTGMGWQEVSETRYYKLDTEDASPYDDVRFHWLNRAGGIDSYTAKRNVIEGVSVSKSTIEKTVGQRMFLKELPILTGDDNGSGTYQPSTNVFNVDASKTNSVYTEPLNKGVAKWLEELITSPNVWIELENEASLRANSDTGHANPSTSNYFPVIITNNSIDTVDEEKGLVKFNIEYSHSHKINTQRN